MRSMITKFLPPLVVVAAFLGGVSFGPGIAFAEPEITSATPADGAVLPVAPEVLNLCFSEPVQTEEGWQFTVSPNGTTDLGLRIVFTTDGSCVDIFPGAPDPAPEGVWQFDWAVTAQADSSEGSGSLSFQVGELQSGQTPVPTPKPPAVDNGDDPPFLLIGLGVVGVLIVIVGVAGFFLRRRNA